MNCSNEKGKMKQNRKNFLIRWRGVELMLWIIPAIILMLIVILLSKVYIEWHYTYQQKQQVIHMKIWLYHVRLFKKEINLSGKQADNLLDHLSVDNFIDKIKGLIHVIQSFRSIVHLLLSKTDIHALTWTTHIGTGDAATTGMTSGALWGVKGVLGGLIIEKGRLCSKPDIRIIPHYERGCLHSDLDCMVSIRVGQAIHAFLKLMMLLSNKEKAYI